MADYEYPRDEFDELASRRAIRGTHRRKESNLKWWISLVAILVISPLLGWGIVQWAGARGSAVIPPRPEASATASAESSASPEGQQPSQETPAANGGENSQADPSSSPQPQEEAKPAPSANLASNVLVLNGAGIQGLAAQYKQKLENSGYTKVTVDNYRRSQPSASTVYYREESDAATAKAIAEAFGINPSQVMLSAEATGTGNQVVVVLRSDIR